MSSTSLFSNTVHGGCSIRESAPAIFSLKAVIHKKGGGEDWFLKLETFFNSVLVMEAVFFLFSSFFLSCCSRQLAAECQETFGRELCAEPDLIRGKNLKCRDVYRWEESSKFIFLNFWGLKSEFILTLADLHCQVFVISFSVNADL